MSDQNEKPAGERQPTLSEKQAAIYAMKHGAQGRLASPMVAAVMDLMTYHEPVDQAQLTGYAAIAQAATSFALAILEHAPPCSDRTRAINAVREARMLGNSAIALRGLW